MSDGKLIPFRPKDSRDASARVEIFEDEEELRLLFELPVTDCAIAITFWKDLAGDDGKASVSVWTRGPDQGSGPPPISAPETGHQQFSVPAIGYRKCSARGNGRREFSAQVHGRRSFSAPVHPMPAASSPSCSAASPHAAEGLF
jgi:hypothetical protein